VARFAREARVLASFESSDKSQPFHAWKNTAWRNISGDGKRRRRDFGERIKEVSLPVEEGTTIRQCKSAEALRQRMTARKES